MTELGTLEELPLEYRTQLTSHNLLPLWPSLRNFLPHDCPARMTEVTTWQYEVIRPLLLQAGELTPMEKAERRVLVLANPGLDLANAKATPSIYIGMQLILPGETAPNHWHTPSAVRFVVEGKGGYTCVNGERCPMEKGDLILTPSGMWHEHGNDGNEPVIWLDALDLPLIYALEASYCLEGKEIPVSENPDASQTKYRTPGLIPYSSLDKRDSEYPMVRYPWVDVRAALLDLSTATGADELVQLAYVNPETGRECLPTLGFSALMLRPGETACPLRRSASSVIHVIEGEGQSVIDDNPINWRVGDTFSIPTHANVIHCNKDNNNSSFLFAIDDAPLQRKLGFYQEFNRDRA